jgi:hypothetical protein
VQLSSQPEPAGGSYDLAAAEGLSGVCRTPDAAAIYSRAQTFVRSAISVFQVDTAAVFQGIVMNLVISTDATRFYTADRHVCEVQLVLKSFIPLLQVKSVETMQC